MSAARLGNPLIVGTHWFQYGDQATTGRGDGENYQIGFVDVCDTPYAETIAGQPRGGRKHVSPAGRPLKLPADSFSTRNGPARGHPARRNRRGASLFGLPGASPC